MNTRDRAKAHYDQFVRLMGAMQATDAKGALVEYLDAVAHACNVAWAVGASGKKVMFIGNGGSAGIASHMAIDFWKNGDIKAVAFNDSSLLTCIGNDYGYNHIFEKPIEMFAEKGDLLFAISSSGRSENILNGVRAAERAGCDIITFSGFNGDNPLRAMGRLNFYVASGEYGFVEVLHQFIIHSVLDVLIQEKKGTFDNHQTA